MSTISTNRGVRVSLLLTVALVLACGVTTIEPTVAPNFDATKAALQLQGTAMSLQLTQSALSSQPQSQPPQQSQPPLAPPTSAPAAPTGVPATATPDLEARIKSAKILVYEDTDALNIGMYVQDALDGMGLKYTQTGSYSGHFMEYLASGVKYDLIVVDAEDHRAITGEFWDVINTRVLRDKPALIVEMWYLNREAAGPIYNILSSCGIAYMKNWTSLDSIYWWDPTNEVFNTPNIVLPLVRWNQYWFGDVGDRVTYASGGDATLLAGPNSTKSNDAVLASCNGGRQIWQFFDDHDYPRAQMVPLWQNYIHYTLKNHFAVTP